MFGCCVGYCSGGGEAGLCFGDACCVGVWDRIFACVVVVVAGAEDEVGGEGEVVDPVGVGGEGL